MRLNISRLEPLDRDVLLDAAIEVANGGTITAANIFRAYGLSLEDSIQLMAAIKEGESIFDIVDIKE